MRRHRTLIILMALAGAIFCAQFGLEAAIIGIAFSAWIIACALMPAPADETTKETHANHRTRPSP